MKRVLKSFLKKINIYHPLQSFYRSAIAFATNKYYTLSYKKYKGQGYVCNFCNAAYVKFVPEYPADTIADAINNNAVIAGYGKNVFCPNCMSKNRERLVLAVLQNILDIKGKKILHFSPEKNLYNYIKTKANIISVDITPGFYKNIDPNILQADATQLQFEEGRFDMIIANHILEHIPEDTKAMREMYRVLKPGGLAVLQVPYSIKLTMTIEEPLTNDPARQEKLFGQKDHVRIYALNDYIKRLESAGFKVKILSPEDLAIFKMYAIQTNESIIIGYK